MAGGEGDRGIDKRSGGQRVLLRALESADDCGPAMMLGLIPSKCYNSHTSYPGVRYADRRNYRRG